MNWALMYEEGFFKVNKNGKGIPTRGFSIYEGTGL